MGKKESDLLNEFLEKCNPNHGKLVKGKKGTYEYHTVLLDAEDDGINCRFNGEDVILDTKDLTYVMFSVDNLYHLVNLLEEANEKIDEDYENDVKLGLIEE